MTEALGSEAEPHRGGPGRFRALTVRDLDDLARRAGLPADQRLALRAVAAVFPFRTNSYVVDELIDWSAVPADPIFRLTFPQPGMLCEPDLAEMVRLLRDQAPAAVVQRAAHEIRMRLNPHPSGQLDLNAPTHEGRRVAGVQRKYAETILVFPRPGQTCHAYCTYCFRWPQFVDEPDLRIATEDVATVTAYLRANPEVTDVLLTGGDPVVMSAAVLSRYVEPLLEIDTVQAVRIGTKALSFWPYRFVADRDADDLLRLFERVVTSGRHLAVMAHVTHPRELRPEVVRTAIRRIRDTGAVVRCQAPLIGGINDRAGVWVELWNELTRLGAVPYYQFVERDTGPQHYFAVPLARGYEIFRDAYARVSGLARTVRGPVMSAMPGKVCVDGIAEVNGERVFVLHLIQARDPGLVGRPFFAAFDPAATWLTDLKPAFGAAQFLPGLDV
ncbi:KamA family radical SAM protein [Planosporangium flavigriseum]|uniref:KamA family radical SAM protein n=1 Tax=Planosporangium flavigriseum TaxID=373681 RepID=A0A8J3PNU8_9ACTN|nr:lysine 2,3-aminomutase [Planosporangium flavigriseum]GIG76382.1 KamA family radical SAM protein [Planosporangium flavigriseum]